MIIIIICKTNLLIFYSNSGRTREVAVQFNPLHTSTKSTSTCEIKQVHSSCQYDLPSDTEPGRRVNVEASVQVDDLNQPVLLVSSSTQYEQKTFLDGISQTEALSVYDHSATNTSVSTTPVSDSMYLDDTLSEGEVFLPWNLRLSGWFLNWF